MDIQKAFGERLRELRAVRGLTQEELAFLSGTQTSHISRIELGQNNTTIDVAYRIAQGLEMRLSELLDFEMKADRSDDEQILKVASYMRTLPMETQEQIVQIVRTFIKK